MLSRNDNITPYTSIIENLPENVHNGVYENYHAILRIKLYNTELLPKTFICLIPILLFVYFIKLLLTIHLAF